MHKYEIVIFWSEEDGVYIAEVPELSGCIAHGETQSAALANVNEAIELWLQTSVEFGDEIPQPREHQLAA